jgi:hypothetical protein
MRRIAAADAGQHPTIDDDKSTPETYSVAIGENRIRLQNEGGIY